MNIRPTATLVLLAGSLLVGGEVVFLSVVPAVWGFNMPVNVNFRAPHLL